MQKLFIIYLFSLTISSCTRSIEHSKLVWKEGYLDIHHIHTGRGDASVFIFPDGTTMLFDVGDAAQRTKDLYYDQYPNDSIAPGAWVAHYIKQVAPRPTLDYAVISHFHSDHFGRGDSLLPLHTSRKYRFSGITEVANQIEIKKLIDRAYPGYDYPYDLFSDRKPDINNYISFIEEEKIPIEQLLPGIDDQIVLLNGADKYPTFSVRNVKVNQHIWTGRGDDYEEFEFYPPFASNLEYNYENPLSINLKINYGTFDYYVGGDLPGVDDFPDYDIESTVANAVREVDVMTLNHHGYLDASNEYFLSTLDPQVVVHQSLHDPHFQENVMTRMADQKLDVYSLAMSDGIRTKYEHLIDGLYKSTFGHVMVRVYPGGDQFTINILKYDGLQLRITDTFGPYISR